MLYHVRGYRMIDRNMSFVYAFGYHIDLLTLTENLPRAVKLMEKHLADALICPGLTWRIDFYLAAHQLLERLREQDTETLKLRLPTAFPLHRPEGEYAVGELSNWFREQTTTLAVQFDARNGTDYYSRRVADHRKMKQWAHPCSLPGKNNA